MLEVMKTGARIEIKPYAEDTRDYAPTTFWIQDGYIWSSSPFVGTFPREEFTAETFAEHIATMVREGFQIVIHC